MDLLDRFNRSMADWAVRKQLMCDPIPLATKTKQRRLIMNDNMEF